MSSEEAKAFVIDTVLKPAIESQLVSQRVRDITKSQIPWVSNFKKVGDVYRYLLSTTRTKDDNVDALQIVGLRTYEDIIPEFKQRFSSKLTDVSDFSDFSVDQEYSWREVLSVVGQYDTRSGGIQLYKVNEELDSIAIKVTLNGGKYLNEWLVPDKLLKYYMKSIKGEFKETYVDNSAIINSPNVLFMSLSDKIPSKRSSFTKENSAISNTLMTAVQNGFSWRSMENLCFIPTKNMRPILKNLFLTP